MKLCLQLSGIVSSYQHRAILVSPVDKLTDRYFKAKYSLWVLFWDQHSPRSDVYQSIGR